MPNNIILPLDGTRFFYIWCPILSEKSRRVERAPFVLYVCISTNFQDPINTSGSRVVRKYNCIPKEARNVNRRRIRRRIDVAYSAKYVRLYLFACVWCLLHMDRKIFVRNWIRPSWPCASWFSRVQSSWFVPKDVPMLPGVACGRYRFVYYAIQRGVNQKEV